MSKVYRKRYKELNLKVKNKIRKLTTYLRKNPNNAVARQRLEQLNG